MPLEDFIKFVSTVGFPIAVTGYVMVRLETTLSNKLGDLTRSINRLTMLLAKHGLELDDE